MSESMPTRKLTVQDLDRFLGLETESNDHISGYLDAAAVLAAFDPFQLRPIGHVGDGQEPLLLDDLLPRCEPITQGPGRGLWSLLLPNRRVALRRLATRERMRQALDANPDRPDLPLQRTFERVVDEDQITLEDASREELAALHTLHDWLDGILEDLPSKTAISRALARFDLLAPMRRLAGEHFVGRERELQQLQDYVFWHEPEEPDPSEPPPPEPPSLFVFGPGGVGKSTLLARFILDKVQPGGPHVVYIDIDRPTIRPDRPATLLLDAIAQLQPQLDVEPHVFEGVTRELSDSIRRGDTERAFESFGSHSWQVELFKDVVGPLLDGAVVLVVVDTFEEAQFLGSDVVLPLVRFLLNLARSLPNLRLVLSGRALPEEYVSQAFPDLAPLAPTQAVDDAEALPDIPMPFRPINLGVLDEEPARELLRRSAAQAELPLLEEDLQDVIRVVSSNPMCLKLAVRLLRDEGIDRLRASRTEFLTRLKAEKIQALLYGRILRHLHGDDVRAVAHPGLIVRRITPEVIREVLAEPCGLHLAPERNEDTIFAELQKEAALVQADPEDGSLRHRVDVRRAMLEDLTDHVSWDVAEQIDRNAVAYYQNRPDPISRAEEIYHRLRLREPVTTMDSRWLPEAADRLKNAGEELPARQRLWLAGKLGVTLDPSVRRTASQEEWEDQAARSAERFLQARHPQAALDLLHERSQRLPRTKLYLLEVEAYRYLYQPDAALRVARAGVEAASKAGAIDLALELLLQMVVIEEGRIRPRSAAELLEEANAVAAHSSNELLRFRVTVTELRLHRQLHPEPSEERRQRRSQALAGLTDELLRMVRTQPVLLREAAAELGKDHPGIAAAAVDTLGVEADTDAQAQALGHAITTLNNEVQPSKAPLARVFVDGANRFPEAGFDPTMIRNWATRELSSKDTRSLSATLAATEPGSNVLRQFRNYFRAGVESSLDVLVRQVEDAVAVFDHTTTTELCEALIAQTRSSDGLFPLLPARRVLSALRRNRQFQLTARVADALISAGRDETVIYRHYAQALLDQGLTSAGLGVVEAAMAAAADDDDERVELAVLVGRAHKDRYLATDAAAERRRALHLERAVQAYHQAYAEDQARLWSGINVTALLHRAARDGVTLAAFPNPKEVADQLAGDVLAAVGEPTEFTPVFDLATAVEANLALGRFEQAHQWLDLYLAHPQTDAFELASTLRQLTEVWGLTPEAEPGSTFLPMLQAKLLERGEGGEVIVGPSVDIPELQPRPEGAALGKVFGSERFVSTRWFSNALDRCRGIARIEDEVGDGVGTGFLVEGAGLHPNLPPVVLITAAHVIPKAIRPEEAFLAFRGLEDFAEPGVRVRRVLWSSPPNELDATILEPEQVPAGALPCPLARNLPSLNADPRERVFVIGHPLGRPDPQLSIRDNHLLDYDDTLVHYRAPAEPGSSGSPVFNRRWAVIALHHAGGQQMPRLHGDGVYEANEGIRIDRIRAALRQKL